MTKKRDLKRRARERKARTGESYVTARRRVVAARAELSPSAVPVVQLHDVSAEAARLGFQCQIAMYPTLCERADPATVLASLRDALIKTSGDPATVRLFGVAFGVRSVAGPPQRSEHGQQQVDQRLRAVLGPASEPGAMVAFRAAGRDGTVPVMCMLFGSALVLDAGRRHDGERAIEHRDAARAGAGAAGRGGAALEPRDRPRTADHRRARHVGARGTRRVRGRRSGARVRARRSGARDRWAVRRLLRDGRGRPRGRPDARGLGLDVRTRNLGRARGRPGREIHGGVVRDPRRPALPGHDAGVHHRSRSQARARSRSATKTCRAGTPR